MVLAIYGIKLCRFVRQWWCRFTFCSRIHWLLAYSLATSKIIVLQLKRFVHIFHTLSFARTISCPHTLHFCWLFENLFWWELDDAMDDFTINCIRWQCEDGLLAKCNVQICPAHCLHIANGFVTQHMCTQHKLQPNTLTAKIIPKLHYYDCVVSWKARSHWFVCKSNALFKYILN